MDIHFEVKMDINSKELKQWTKNLQSIAKNAYPKTVRSALDRTAFLAQKEYKKFVKTKFIIREPQNNIILKSLHYNKCGKSLKISDMQSSVGQLARTFGKKTEQLKIQEKGESVIAKGKHLYRPEKVARGGSKRRKVQKEYLRKNLEIKTIQDIVPNPTKSAHKEVSQAVAYMQNNKQGVKKIHFLPSQESNIGIRGIAEITKGNSATKKKQENYFKQKTFKYDPNEKEKQVTNAVKWIYEVRGKVQHLKPRQTLEPASTISIQRMPETFVHEAQRRIERELSKGLKN